MFSAQPSPLLLAELSYPTHRGKVTSGYWCLYYLGAILASWTTFGTQRYDSSWAWRIPTILQAGIPAVQLLFFYFLPESPRWLVSQDRNQEALQILTKYHAGGEVDSPLVLREMTEIVETIKFEQEAKATGWSTLVATPGNRKRLFIAVSLGAMAQWNGIGVVSYYLTLVLDTVGITDPFLQTLINGLLQIFNFVVAITAAFLVDRLGRRTLFNFSGIVMLLSYIVWTACSAVNNETGSQPAGIVVIVCLFVFYLGYDCSYTPLLISYPTEIFPFSIRSKGLTCELLSIYASLVIAAFVNPIGLDNIGWRYYIVFCCFLVSQSEIPIANNVADLSLRSSSSPLRTFSFPRLAATLWRRSQQSSMGQTQPTAPQCSRAKPTKLTKKATRSTLKSGSTWCDITVQCRLVSCRSDTEDARY